MNKKSDSKRQKYHEINCWTDRIHVDSHEGRFLEFSLENFEEDGNYGGKNNESGVDLSWNECKIVDSKVEAKEDCYDGANLSEVADGMMTDVEIFSVFYNF